MSSTPSTTSTTAPSSDVDPAKPTTTSTDPADSSTKTPTTTPTPTGTGSSRNNSSSAEGFIKKHWIPITVGVAVAALAIPAVIAAFKKAEDSDDSEGGPGDAIKKLFSRNTVGDEKPTPTVPVSNVEVEDLDATGQLSTVYGFSVSQSL